MKKFLQILFITILITAIQALSPNTALKDYKAQGKADDNLELAKLDSPAMAVYNIARIPHNVFILSEKSIYVLNTLTGKIDTSVLVKEGEIITSSALDSEKETIVCTTNKGKLIFFDLFAMRQFRHEFESSDTIPTSLAMKEGQLIAGFSNGDLKIYNVDAKEQKIELEKSLSLVNPSKKYRTKPVINDIKINTNGSYVYIGGDQLYILRLMDMKVFMPFSKVNDFSLVNISNIQLSEKRDLLFFTAFDDLFVLHLSTQKQNYPLLSNFQSIKTDSKGYTLYKLKNDIFNNRLNIPKSIVNISLSPDENILSLFAETDGMMTNDKDRSDREIIIIDMKTGNLKQRIKNHTGSLSLMEFTEQNVLITGQNRTNNNNFFDLLLNPEGVKESTLDNENALILHFLNFLPNYGTNQITDNSQPQLSA